MTVTAPSGLTTFSPDAGEMVLTALSRIKIEGPQIEARHLTRARTEAGLLQSEWMNRQVNLFTVELQTINPLIVGQPSYTLNASTLDILDAYVSVSDGAGGFIDRPIMPMSRTEYANQPQKVLPSPPTSFWLNRQTTPVLHIWPTCDTATTYILNYYRLRQNYDAVLPGGVGVDAPVRFYDAFVAGLAYRLSKHFRQELEDRREKDYEKAWRYAVGEDHEHVDMYVYPGLSSYFR
jgi:hypothetical protein